MDGNSTYRNYIIDAMYRLTPAALYAVTDRTWVGEKTLYQQVEEALRGGVTCVQLREKDMGDEDFLQEAKEIHALCQQYGVPFIVNDNVAVAVACGAEGIHVGQ